MIEFYLTRKPKPGRNSCPKCGRPYLFCACP